VASAILMELNIRLTVLVVETARLERRGVNDNLINIDTSKNSNSALIIEFDVKLKFIAVT
jgi:hypothetical protein